MKAEFTAQDHAQLKAWKISPDLDHYLALSQREAALLIHQLQLDLEATEAELKVLQRQDLTSEGLKQAYRNLDAQCSKMTRLLERAETMLRAERRKRRAWQASALCLAGGVAFWLLAGWAWNALAVTWGRG